MKNSIWKLIVGIVVVSIVLTGCASKSGSTPAPTKKPEEQVIKEDQTETKTPDTDNEVSSKTDAQRFAEELLTRHVTQDDNVTEEVIQELINILKEKYQFEKLDNLKIASAEWVYVADGKGWLNDLYGDNGTKISVVEGTIGNEAQLMERNELHISSRMLYPYLIYKSKGAQISAIQISENPDPKIVTILVNAKSDINSFEDLKGKKIGSWNAGCQYVALIERTEELGWEEGKDWNYVNVSNDGLKTALVAGELDAISVHPLTSFNPGIIDGTLKEIGNAAPDGTYVNNGGASVVFSPTEFAKNNKNILSAFLKIREAIASYILNNEDEAATVVEGITRVPAENTIFWWERSKETFFVSNDTLENLKLGTEKYQNWLVEHGTINQSDVIATDDFFLTTYFE